MKLKDLIKLPEKTIFEQDDYGDIIVTVGDFMKAGANGMIDQIGNLEIELDVEKIKEILNQDLPYLENSEDKIDRVHAEVMRSNNATSAQIIADTLKEIIK